MKILSILTLLIATSFAINAQLPYSKLLGLNNEELKDGHFKYDKEKNQHVLKKSNGLNNTMNVLSALNGQTADVKPHKDDYVIVRQEGENEVSSLTVVFYNDDRFHEIQTWLAENNIDFIETNSGKLTIQKFKFDDYDVQLDIEKRGITTTTGRTGALAKSIDESYNVYVYNIYTGVPPSSKWHDKQAQKKAKRDEKGKKKELDDLM